MPTLVEAYDALLAQEAAHWLVREIVLYWKRTLKRLDVSSRSLIALVEPGSCFAGTLFELVLAADRSYMLDGAFEGSNLPAATVRLTAMNFGPYPMGNGLTRLDQPLPGRAEARRRAQGRDRRGARRRGRRRAWASSPSRPTTSTGRTRCGSPSRSAPASRPTG